MKTIGLLVGLLLMLPLVAQAQTAVGPGSQFGWTEVAADLASANGFTYRVYLDTATTGVTVTATCTGTASPFTCRAPIPAVTPTVHTATLTAANVAGESVKSAPVTFTMTAVPSAPGGLVVIP